MTESPSSGRSASTLSRIFENGSTPLARIGLTSSVLNLRAIGFIPPNDSDGDRQTRRARGPKRRNHAEPRAACAIHQLASGVLFAASAGICCEGEERIDSESSRAGSASKAKPRDREIFECSSQRAAKSAMRSMPKSRSNHALTPAMSACARSWARNRRPVRSARNAAASKKSLQIKQRDRVSAEPAKDPGRKSSSRTAAKIESRRRICRRQKRHVAPVAQTTVAILLARPARCRPRRAAQRAKRNRARLENQKRDRCARLRSENRRRNSAQQRQRRKDLKIAIDEREHETRAAKRRAAARISQTTGKVRLIDCRSSWRSRCATVSISSKSCGRFVGSSSRSIIAVAAKQAAMRDVVPFRDQMRGDEHGLAALRFEAKRFLQSFSPAGIETQARFVEQKNRCIGQQQEGDAEPLTHAAGKLVGANLRDIAQIRRDRAWLRNARPGHRATARKTQNFQRKSCADENSVVAADRPANVAPRFVAATMSNPLIARISAIRDESIRPAISSSCFCRRRSGRRST